jgi:hypothetical protein
MSESDDAGDECSQILTAKARIVRKQYNDAISSGNTSTPKPRETSKRRNCYSWLTGVAQREPDAQAFRGDTQDGLDNFADYHSPVDYFRYFFTGQITELIKEQTVLYSEQERPSKPLNLAEHEVENFIGIVMYMSLIKLATSRAHWSAEFRTDQIAEVMTSNRFHEIKRFMHFSDNSLSTNDKLRKIRPLLDLLSQRYASVPLEENLSVDEQMIPFKGRSGLKQYMAKKPHKWGYKMFVLAGVSGYTYNFEFYTGKDDNIMLEGERDYGASGNVVIRLSRTITPNVNHKLLFDNYFNSPDLQLYLAGKGILSVGTVRLNRVPQLTMPSEKILKGKGRGSFFEQVATVEGTQLSAVCWYDNRVMSLLSTFVSSEPVNEVTRWSNKNNKQIKIPCPAVVQVYNKHMGGVDLVDSLIGLYRSRLRSKKWYHRIFFHLIDMTVVNAWLHYKKAASRAGSSADSKSQKIMKLHEFKASVARALCRSGQEARKRGRPLSSDNEDHPVGKRRRIVRRVEDTLRADGFDHWPKWCAARGRCRKPNCKGTSKVTCSKCKVHLCFTPKMDCFSSFHNAE